MNEQQLAAEVASVIVGEGRRPEARVSELATGGLDEATVLAELAGRSDAEEILAACRPLDEAFREGVVERVVSLQRREASRRRPAWSRPGSHRPERRRMPLLGTWAVTAGLAAATAAVLVFQWRPADLPPLPAYDESFAGADALVRGAEPAPVPQGQKAPALHLKADSTLDWEIYPATDAGEVVVHGFILRNGTATPWSPPVEISPAGAVRLSGVVRDLGIPTGESTLVLSVRRPATAASGWRALFSAAPPDEGPLASAGFAHTIIVE